MSDKSSIRFSVIIPIYNKERFLRDSVKAALAQDHPAAEIVLVDDGSVDGGIASIQDLIGDSARLIRQRNAGPGAARNRGIAEAQGDWVALLDADDLWLPDHLSTLADLVAAWPQADLVTSGFRRIPADAAPAAELDRATQGYILDFFRGIADWTTVWSSAVAIRRSAFVATTGFGDVWPGEDSAFWARFALDHQIAATRKVTAFYRLGTGGIMHTGTTSGHDRSRVSGNPVIATLDLALADPRYETKHAELSRMRQTTFLVMAKRALYRGEAARARDILTHLSRPLGQTARAYQLLALLPAPARRAAIRGVTLAGNMRRRLSRSPAE